MWISKRGKAGVNSTSKDPIFMEISCVQLSTSKLASMLAIGFAAWPRGSTREAKTVTEMSSPFVR